MKKFIKPCFALAILAFLVWSFSIVTPVSSYNILGITNTPAVSSPTPLPTEMLTATPTLPPTSTPLPSPTPTSTPTSVPYIRPTQPTPQALPPMGNGKKNPDFLNLNNLVMRIQIPALDLDSLVKGVPYVQGVWDISDLGVWIGWLETSSLPELGGNTVLIGHLDMKDGAPGPFYNLTLLEPGMKIVVYSGGTAFHYHITQKTVEDLSDISALAETHTPRLTLLTCYKPSWDPTNRIYLQRQIIIAELDGSDE